MSRLTFPDGFVWGAATSSHQIEGGNVNNDWWAREHAPDAYTIEPSGDACDSYHRYPEDVAIVADLGLGSYRFSLEWSRIEPADGEFSRAARDHYRRMVDTCLQAGVVPNVSLNHFTVPRWFDEGGGWTAQDAADRFARFTEFVEPVVARDVPWVCTINEPNITACFANLAADTTFGGVGLPAPDLRIADGLTAAHHRAVEIVRSWGGPRVGWAVATQAYDALPGCEEQTARYAEPRETRFLHEATGDDWLGIQAYTRTFVGPDGPLPVAEGVETTLTGWEYFPDAVGVGLRTAAREVPGVPLLVTENGIATADDERRRAYTEGALRSVHAAVTDGIDVLGYYHWSLLDNFEWVAGYRPTFGLVAVDRSTFTRTVKPSARWLGGVARANALG
ncbi:family 1 glycosylhydrolase [Modestobacter sp. I12A-02628]|uniref:Family 1 glycosylhydrolase n=1 Tax=Goekera deserti TaxID=2497753 RepID=A0A7K3WG69_9ACTN|nr:family 1 glycosylhydrolase [Goekera deserti]MPQ96581.1 family 1 glycosylhydrolase [Goekera deserti]NDI47107.1 family 1 glycosylhydrolase [Goekera deserti]NEL55495.1 family 1 glycosylhydrolase [Goekera deserti]